MTDNESGHFELINSNQVAFVSSDVTAGTHSIIIQIAASNASNTPQSYTVTFNVAAPVITGVLLNPNSLLANSAIGTNIGPLTAQSTGGLLTGVAYALTNNDTGRFQILSGNQVAALLNNIAEGMHNVVVQVTATNAVTQSFTVPISAYSTLSVATPTAGLTGATKAVNGTYLGGVPTGATYQFLNTLGAVVSSGTVGAFTNNAGNGIWNGTVVEPATAGTYTLRITATGPSTAIGTSASFPVTATSTITITGVSISANTFPAGSSPGTVIGLLTALSAGGALTGVSFAMTNSEGGNFQLVGSTVEVLSGSTLAGAHSVTIQVTASNATNSPQSYSVPLTATGASSTLVSFPLTSTAGALQTGMIFKMGLPIPPGVFASGQALTAVDDLANPVPVRFNTANIQNGWVRHVNLTGKHPSIAAGATRTITVSTTAGPQATDSSITPAQLLAATIGGDSYETLVTITKADGTIWTASARAALAASNVWNKAAPHYKTTWIDNGYIAGPVCSAPFMRSGVADPFLRAQFHIEAYKQLTTPFDQATNPIIFVKTRVWMENGYKVVASPVDVVYDLLIQKGLTALSTAYQLNGGTAGDTLTLSAAGTSDREVITATRSVGTFAPKTFTGTYDHTTSDNANLPGKAIVEIGGRGRARIVDWISSSQVYAIASQNAFSSTTVSAWKTMGVYHSYATHYDVPVYWGVEPQYKAVLSAAYIRSTGMVPNFTVRPATIAATDVVINATRDGSHPGGMSAGNGTIRNSLLNEESTGDADHIGVLAYTQIGALTNWDTDYANASLTLFETARYANMSQMWLRDEDTGGLMGIDKSGLYTWDPRNTFAQPMPGFGTFTLFLMNQYHTGSRTYLAYLLGGELWQLEALAAHSYWFQFSFVETNDTDWIAPVNVNATASAQTVFTATAALANITGEAIGVIDALPSPNIKYMRILSATTFSLYDTRVHALAGGSTGIVSINFGAPWRLFNGFTYNYGCTAKGQARGTAWANRTQAQMLACMPDDDVKNAALLGPMCTKANHRRYVDSMGAYFNGPAWAGNSSFVAGGPRWVSTHTNDEVNFQGPEWQNGYNRFAINNLIESLGLDVSHDWYQFQKWYLAEVNQWLTRGDVATDWAPSVFYRILNPYGGGATSYSYSGQYQRNFLDNAMNFGNFQGGTDFYPAGLTATIASVTNQAAVSVAFNQAVFDPGNLVQYVGASIGIGGDGGGPRIGSGGLGRIVSVSNSTHCVANFTVFGSQSAASGTWTNIANSNNLFVLMFPPAPSYNPWTTSFAYPSSFYEGNDGSYKAIYRGSIELTKQYGVDTANYAGAVAKYTSQGYPAITATPNVNTTPDGLWSIGSIKFIATSRI